MHNRTEYINSDQENQLTPGEIDAAYRHALAAAEEEAGWDDEDDPYRWELGPGPGYNDTPENNDRIARSRKGGTR